MATSSKRYVCRCCQQQDGVGDGLAVQPRAMQCDDDGHDEPKRDTVDEQAHALAFPHRALGLLDPVIWHDGRATPAGDDAEDTSGTASAAAEDQACGSRMCQRDFHRAAEGESVTNANDGNSQRTELAKHEVSVLASSAAFCSVARRGDL
ncbi:hypothetical protein FQA39_LY18699 [Lamprigera yunnana]|nr:hypothetical protein FQA39_LY18699 [Lamprigera yunnana]